MMFDIIGDIHGCHNELIKLLNKLGYISFVHGMIHPHRIAVFAGDLCDRGPSNVAVLKTVMKMVSNRNAVMVMGNHDHKLMRFLKGNKVNPSHGLAKTIAELNNKTDEFRQKVYDFLAAQPLTRMLDNDKLCVVHAAAPRKYQGELSGKKKKAQQAMALYGVTTGKVDMNGYPGRVDWAETYDGDTVVVHGHVAQLEPSVKNRVYNVDTGCVFGNKLTALRYPEMEFVSVNAEQKYAEHKDFI